MESILKEIIACDRQAKNQVEDKKKAKRELESTMNDYKKKLLADEEAALQKRIADLKDANQKALNQYQADLQKNLDNDLKALQALYDQSKDEWLDTMFQQCIGDCL